jgi:hypothetical protein
MSLIDAMTDVAGSLSALSGLTGATSQPPHPLPSYPYAIVYAGDGQVGLQSGGHGGFGLMLANIVVEILQGQVNPLSIASASVWPERVFPLLTVDQSLGGTVEHIVWPVTFSVVNIEYDASEIYAACRMVIPVKLVI